MKLWSKRMVSHAAQAFWLRRGVEGSRSLLYHSVTLKRRQDSQQMTIPVDLFEEQMAFLVNNGYVIQRASDAIGQWNRENLLDSKTVLLTFDDGFADNYTYALPILRKYRLPATIFLIASAHPDDLTTQDPPGKYLAWSQIDEMKGSGLIEFGCHSATHQNLCGLREETLWKETRDAKTWLEDHLRCPVSFFAYPFGSYGTWDRRVRKAVQEAGFRGAFTSVFGLNRRSSDLFLLKRSRVSWCDEITEFKRLLEGAYDWYASLQRLQSLSKYKPHTHWRDSSETLRP